MQKATFLFFLLAICLANFAKAQTETDSLLRLINKSAEDTNKVNLLKIIGGAWSHQDPRKAIEYWKQGVTLSHKLNYHKGLSRNYINIGTGYSYIGKFDSTIIYADSGIIYTKIINDTDRLALVYLNKGDGYRNLGDYRSALLYCDTASMYAAKTTNIDRQARIYDIISGIYASQNQFGTSMLFQTKALELYKKDNNTMMVGQVYDDIGLLYKQNNKLDSALVYHKRAIEIGESIKDYKNLSFYYYGAANIYTDQGKYKEAEHNAARSLEHARQQENNIQLASAYSLLCNIYIKQKRYTEAVKAGHTAYQFSLDELQAGLQQESSALLAQAYTGTGDYQNAYQFITISNNLKDSLSRQLFNGQVASLQSSFEFKEKDKEILLLSKNKELQQQKLQRQRLLMIAGAAIALLALFGTWLLMNRHKVRQRMKVLELRNRIAADLHDEVGSSLSSIHMLGQMATQQTGSDEKQNAILVRMSSNAKETMEKMGDIVWMIKPNESEAESLKQRMERFAYEIGVSKNIEVRMQVDELEKAKLNMEQRKNIYLIFKEALNNAVKYSGTEIIDINADRQNKQLTLLVKDYGKGFNTETTASGNGLDNMKNRAQELGATIELSSETGKGTAIQLIIPQ